MYFNNFNNLKHKTKFTFIFEFSLVCCLKSETPPLINIFVFETLYKYLDKSDSTMYFNYFWQKKLYFTTEPKCIVATRLR